MNEVLPDALALVTRLELPLLAQASTTASGSSVVNDTFGQVQKSLGGTVGGILPSLLGAIVALVIGWLLALVASWLVGSLLKKTDLDNRILRSISGGDQLPGGVSTEKLGATAAFWLVFLFAILTFLNTLQLNSAAQPFNNVLNQVMGFIPKLVSAGVLAAVAWLVATAVKAIVGNLARSTGIDRRLQVGSGEGGQPVVPSNTIANLLYYFVFLFFLPLILDVLDLKGPLAPVQNLLDRLLGALPNIFQAIIIGAIGWFVAKFVRDLVTNLLLAAGAEKLGARVGWKATSGGQSLSGVLGNLAYVLVLIPVAIAALGALNVPEISRPATGMLEQVMTAIPQIATAGFVLFLSYLASKFVAELVTNLLSSMGFDNITNVLGLPAGVSDKNMAKTPSQILGIVTQVGIILFGAVTAISILNLPRLTAIVEGLMAIAGQVLMGLVVFAIGLYLAQIAYNLVSAPGTQNAKILGQGARVVIIGFVAAMALQVMGIAPNIVNLAFGLLLGAIAVAIAISFGLGGRDAASELVRDWLAIFRK
jgi:hypothetical protein